MDQRFTWNERLHQKRDFTAAIRQGKRWSLSGVILWVYHRPDVKDAKPRLGLAIPGAFGNAVRRNRLKRLLRETFRLHKTELPLSVDLVFSARAMAGPLRFAGIEALVLDLWTRANLRPSPSAASR
jgi:ribonuclease P protein component